MVHRAWFPALSTVPQNYLVYQYPTAYFLTGVPDCRKAEAACLFGRPQELYLAWSADRVW